MKKTIDKRNGIPYYLQIQEIIQGWLDDGEFREDEAIPSIPKLAKLFDVTQKTVHRTIIEMTHKGVLQARRGKGVFVKKTRTAPKIKRIGLFIGDLLLTKSSFLLNVIQGINNELGDSAKILTLISEPIENWDKTGIKSSIDGAIILTSKARPEAVAALHAQGFPHTLMTYGFKDIPSANVALAVRPAMGKILEYLTSLGHRNFGVIAGHNKHLDLEKRIGIEKTAKKLRIPDKNIIWKECNYIADLACSATEEILKENPETSAIIAYDDDIAICAMQTLQRLRINVPKQISVTGFNDIPAASLVTPPLSTMSAPMRELGEKSLKLLLEQIDAGNNISKKIVLKCELITRASCAEKC